MVLKTQCVFLDRPGHISEQRYQSGQVIPNPLPYDVTMCRALGLVIRRLCIFVMRNTNYKLAMVCGTHGGYEDIVYRCKEWGRSTSSCDHRTSCAYVWNGVQAAPTCRSLCHKEWPWPHRHLASVPSVGVHNHDCSLVCARHMDTICRGTTTTMPRVGTRSSSLVPGMVSE